MLNIKKYWGMHNVQMLSISMCKVDRVNLLVIVYLKLSTVNSLLALWQYVINTER